MSENYTTVATSQSRPFSVTVGTSPGYLNKISATIADHQKTDIHHAVLLIQNWIKDCIISDRPYLNGIVETSHIVYGYKGEDEQPVVSSEPTVRFFGVLSPAHDKNLSDVNATQALDEIADILGKHYNQTRVYVELGGKTWIRQAVGKTTPRQD